jgi:hypothetical protein
MSNHGIHDRPLHAPRENHATLMAPPLDQVSAMVAKNRSLRNGHAYDLQGRSLAELSQQARRELLDAAYRWTTSYRDVAAPHNDSTNRINPIDSANSIDSAPPIFLAGHQPQIVHPGVWLKNFVLGKLSQQAGATAINLVVDSDTLADASLRVPTGSVAEPRAVQVAFDQMDQKIPYEERAIEDRELFETFGRRVMESMTPLVAHPLIEQFWPMVLARAKARQRLGACFAQARHQLEGDWGLQTLEVAQSQVCSSESFSWFTAHLLSRLSEFRVIYNESIREYRRKHRIRSASHPAPELVEDDEWQEAPFWMWTAENPERQRLFARQACQTIVLSDRRSWEASLPFSSEGDISAAAAKFQELQRDGVKIRSRALITTLWARLFLCDLFIHGIGGAKYDAVTDRIIERFFGIDPPGLMVVSGTLHLPIKPQNNAMDAKAESVHAVVDSSVAVGAKEGIKDREIDAQTMEQALREMTFHPERFLKNDHAASSDVDAIVAEKKRWIETSQTRENARQRCQAIRQANAALQPWLVEQRKQLEEHHFHIAKHREAENLLTWREYGFCLYPAETLQDFLTKQQ